MKHLTNEMTRLCHEIGASHRARRNFIRDLKHDVASTRKANCQAFRTMAKCSKAERVKFFRDVKSAVMNMKNAVCVMRQGFADDIAGARHAWFGRKA